MPRALSNRWLQTRRSEPTIFHFSFFIFHFYIKFNFKFFFSAMYLYTPFVMKLHIKHTYLHKPNFGERGGLPRKGQRGMGEAGKREQIFFLFFALSSSLLFLHLFIFLLLLFLLLFFASLMSLINLSPMLKIFDLFRYLRRYVSTLRNEDWARAGGGSWKVEGSWTGDGDVDEWIDWLFYSFPSVRPSVRPCIWYYLPPSLPRLRLYCTENTHSENKKLLQN